MRKKKTKLDPVFPNWILLKVCMSFSVMTFKAAKNFLKLSTIKMILWQRKVYVILLL